MHLAINLMIGEVTLHSSARTSALPDGYEEKTGTRKP